MNSSLIQLLVLAGIAVFLILRLRSVLGTREGYEEPRQEGASQTRRKGPDLEVIEGGPDQDILDHAEEGSVNALALAKMKSMEPQFFAAIAVRSFARLLRSLQNGNAKVKAGTS